MRSLEEINQLIEIARATQCPWVEIDGVKFPLVQLMRESAVIDSDPAEAFKEASALDGYSDEEILYYATPYFDELQAKKEEKKKRIEEEATIAS